MMLKPLYALALLSASLATAATRTQNFDSDPNWEGVNNRITPKELPPPVSQDFGYSGKTSFAGAMGEMGGKVTRASAPAFYADKIESVTLDKPLSASGTFALTQSNGGSGMFFGFFTSQQPGSSGRPIGSLGLDMDCEGHGARLAVRLITAKNQSCGTFITPFIPGKFRPTPIRNDGTRYTWTLKYDPDAAGARGQFTFTLHGDAPKPEDIEKPDLPAAHLAEARQRFPRTTTFTVDLPEGYKQQGTTFDHFGMMNMMKPGGHLTIYFDDLKYNDHAQDFSHDPDWDASGNRKTYQPPDAVGAQNFGFSPDTLFAAGEKKGELGGTFWRSEANPASYADRIGPLSSDDTLQASGTIAFTSGSPDSGMFIGFFNSSTPQDEKGLKNVLAVRVEGPTRIGHYFAPLYVSSTGSGAKMESGAPVLHPDGKPHKWSLHYSPADHTLQITLDAESATLKIDPKRAGKAEFDRFGVFTPKVGGSQVKLYLDDLTYTSSR
jgi:hypothetical protein